MKKIALFAGAALCFAAAGMTSDTATSDTTANDTSADKKKAKTPKRDEKLFKKLFENRVAGKPQNCISSIFRNNLIPVGEDVLALRRGNIVYRNNLKSRCRGLSDDDILVVQIRSGQLCKNDRVDRVDRFAGGQRSFCVLGEFVPYRVAEKTKPDL